MTCPRCKREIHPWPLVRGGRCSPRDWVYCIRNDMDNLIRMWESDGSEQTEQKGESDGETN